MNKEYYFHIETENSYSCHADVPCLQEPTTLGNHEVSVGKSSKRYLEQGSDKPRSLHSRKVRFATLDLGLNLSLHFYSILIKAAGERFH